MQTPPHFWSGFYGWWGVCCIVGMGKIMKKFSDFYFSSYHRKLGWFFHKNDTKMTITRKIKIGEFWNLVLLSIQPIADLSSKFEKCKKKKLDFDCMVTSLIFFKIKKNIYFSNFDERSAIGWIESRTKFQNSLIFIFRVTVILVSFLWKNHSNFRW